jgi:ATP-dependent Clp protease protease subunit
MNLFSIFKKKTNPWKRLLRDGIIVIDKLIDAEIANLTIAQMLFLESAAPQRDMSLYINSPGGSIPASMAIFDTIEYVRPDVKTICLGQATGAAALLVAQGTRGKRFAVPSAIFRLVPAEILGEAELTQSQMAEVERMDRKCIEAFGKCLHRSRRQIRQACKDYLTLTSHEALVFGIIDGIVQQEESAEI